MLGYLPLDLAEVQTQAGKLYLVVALARTSKRAFAELPRQATPVVAVDFWRRVFARIPNKVHKLLPNNGVQFRHLPHHLKAGRHPVGQLCAEWGSEPRFTKPAHPWTTGQVERMNRPRKEAPLKRFHYNSSLQLAKHLPAFLRAYNFAKRLKRLKGLTPYEFICAEWQKNPSIFHPSPADLTPGPYT